jgi:hypothetical protein
MTLKGTTPTLTIGDAGAEDTKIVFDGNAQDYYIGLDDSADDLIIGKGSAVGTTPAVVIDENLNVGIGTTSPFSKTQITETGWSSGAPYGTVLTVTGNDTNDANWGHLLITDSSTGTGNGGMLRFATGSTSSDISPFAGLDGFTEGANYGGLKFLTRANGGTATEKMRIDSSGNVGIGTTSPSSYYSKELVVAASDNGGITIVNSDTSHAAYLMFADGTSGADAYRGQIGYDHNNNSMFFSTDSTLRLMIDSSGKVFIGLSAQINSSMLSVGDGGVGITYSGAPANYYRQIYQSSSGNLFFYNGSNQGYIDQAGAFNDASDERIKKDIEDISYGLDTVKALKPRKYKMKLNDDEQIGFIAQEVESLVPEIVNTGETPDGEEQKGMSYGHLTAVLTKAIQEQQTLIETLQAKVEALENG